MNEEAFCGQAAPSSPNSIGIGGYTKKEEDMGFTERLNEEVFGPEKQHNEDGSVTSRYLNGETWVSNPDGSVREHSYDSRNWTAFPWEPQYDRVTVDGNGNFLNSQPISDESKAHTRR